MLIDFHSHILPGIDDGSRSIEESIAILDTMAQDGVKLVVATPHFYCHDISAEKFLIRRDMAFEELRPYLKPEHPKILLGAEVLYSSRLASEPLLEKLCIQGTNYLLLEMPYVRLTNNLIDGVEELTDLNRVSIIIAHIERYLHFTAYSDLEDLMSLDVVGQLNSKSFSERRSRKNCIKLIKQGYAHILGTDFHRIDRGDLPLSYGYDIISSKISPDEADLMVACSEMIIKNADIDKIILMRE